ncbi:hypothetical protein CDD82_3665 [Ophiocordyceps australis]|uniref:Capsule polysaccharide biosynthesis protein n=1 Tax=Ophiocordyceps australis TaxID=1399860 RepID=A0A2C5YGB9_9HYPO|nr:hypothetical protein CDD82_3665 [Ophiocordyceps australis]
MGMETPFDYPMPVGLYAIPHEQLDLRPDAQIDAELVEHKPVSSEKNIWFFWDTGFAQMHGYAQRTVRAWHRRFSKQGWTVRVVNCKPGSRLNMDRFLDVNDGQMFPQAFANGSITGTYARQHMSDLARWPLLLRYGGVYADVGLMQIGDLDAAWTRYIANPDSPFEVLTFHMDPDGRTLTNYFMAARPGNAFLLRCHGLFLRLWEGRTSTEGMHSSPLLRGLGLMTGIAPSFEEDGKVYDSAETARMLSDYIAQGQVMRMVLGVVDDQDDWNGPHYVAHHICGLEYMSNSQLINDMTAWNGPRQFELLSLPLPQEQMESKDQQQARQIVEACLCTSFSFKLAHGLIVRVMGDTLGSLWRRHSGSDCVAGTYADWLRHGMVFWSPRQLPQPSKFGEGEPIKRGPLLSEC